MFLNFIPSKFVIKFNCSIRFFTNDGLVAIHYSSYGTFFYNKIGSIIPMVVLPTTEIIEPNSSYQIECYIPQAHDSSSEQQDSKQWGQRDGKMID